MAQNAKGIAIKAYSWKRPDEEKIVEPKQLNDGRRPDDGEAKWRGANDLKLPSA